MPILNDIMDHKVIGREFKRGRREGHEEGLQKRFRPVFKRVSGDFFES